MKYGESLGDFFRRAMAEADGVVRAHSVSKGLALRKFALGDTTGAFRCLLAAFLASRTKPTHPITAELELELIRRAP